MSPAGQRWVVTRRRFLTSAATLTAGLVARETTPRAADGGAPQVREPAVGQSWRYAKRDYFTGSMLDTQVDRVSAVGQIIEVESSSGSGDDKTTPDAAWGAAWLRKNISGGRIRGRLPSEIQASWGMVLVDPHWSEIQMYEKPLPLWPAQLRPGWSITVNTQYMTPESPDELPWQLTMHAHRWESIIVPAGRFLALRYNNLINFRFTNISERVAAQRLETIWFAPEIGRWVARESTGTYSRCRRAVPRNQLPLGITRLDVVDTKWLPGGGWKADTGAGPANHCNRVRVMLAPFLGGFAIIAGLTRAVL